MFSRGHELAWQFKPAPYRISIVELAHTRCDVRRPEQPTITPAPGQISANVLNRLQLFSIRSAPAPCERDDPSNDLCLAEILSRANCVGSCLEILSRAHFS